MRFYLYLVGLTVGISAVESFVIQRPQSSSLRSSLATITKAHAMPDHSSSSPVIVVGSANQDLIAYTSKLPEQGETVMGEKFETSCGGKGANQAIAAASLGLAPVSMICRVGKDAFGQELLKNFDNAKVQYDKECTTLSSGVSTGVAHIVVNQESGDNQIIVIPGANNELSPSDAENAVTSLLDTTPKTPPVVVAQLEIMREAALEALRSARAAGARTVLNTAPAPEGKYLDDFYPHIDILIPNETELRTICGKDSGSATDDSEEEAMARSLLDKGVQEAVVVTLGARGAMIVSKKKESDNDVQVVYVSAPPDLPCRNDPVVDTIGAGDAFCGALSTYLAVGLDLESAATKACGFASMSVRKKGAQSSYPTADELPDCLKELKVSVEL